eukprot:CAMPEP_0172504910 /NCGR_PEP_ID=MMETSP1066-20121228/182166_1 /TAXON_ID=671091 /ORGANISM="Coscinodiscus wailesii, Strain CCMP2513" /LENGTH=100 /DNA_ID=CAMNT_0013281305 /DNA_START=35 /DNA_END=334 /DNA_ORIENTATION=+
MNNNRGTNSLQVVNNHHHRLDTSHDSKTADTYGRSVSLSSDELTPNDVIDSKDGHIWRARYCVLQNGVLYFYRNALDADSPEARMEREEGLHLTSTSTGG